MERIGYILVGLMALATLIYGLVVAFTTIGQVITVFGGAL